jgi:hypothetical protein
LGFAEDDARRGETGVAIETLTVPNEVEAAAGVLAEHFDPDELYWAMIDAARERAQ